MLERYTAYQPMQTTTTTTTWLGWQTISPRCYGCTHSRLARGRLVCQCASRTVKRTAVGDECMSYRVRSNA